ncbi:hypothetical protein CHARACLAT_017956 [Characodon lateralis]|uniref:Uncharacterized protein n=1 Tax=Characodon lateralis TaxID=208331 RepID=A0ABU7F665_9TELE|nr:hypothetical protein [Characodon lateralis]
MWWSNHLQNHHVLLTLIPPTQHFRSNDRRGFNYIYGARPTLHKIEAGDAYSWVSSARRESSPHFDTFTSLICVNETQQGSGNERTSSSNERKDRENEEAS